MDQNGAPWLEGTGRVVLNESSKTQALESWYFKSAFTERLPLLDLAQRLLGKSGSGPRTLVLGKVEGSPCYR